MLGVAEPDPVGDLPDLPPPPPRFSHEAEPRGFKVFLPTVQYCSIVAQLLLNCCSMLSNVAQGSPVSKDFAVGWTPRTPRTPRHQVDSAAGVWHG